MHRWLLIVLGCLTLAGCAVAGGGPLVLLLLGVLGIGCTTLAKSEPSSSATKEASGEVSGPRDAPPPEPALPSTPGALVPSRHNIPLSLIDPPEPRPFIHWNARSSSGSGRHVRPTKDGVEAERRQRAVSAAWAQQERPAFPREYASRAAPAWHGKPQRQRIRAKEPR